MRTSRMLALVLIIGMAAAAASSVADDPQAAKKLDQDILGTWKMVSAKYGGSEFQFPEGMTHIKHVTPSQFMWASYDKDGKVFRAVGGSYTLKDDTYEETPGYGMSTDFDLLKGKAQTFKCKIDGNTWHHDGKLSNGTTIEEVWERVERE